MDIKLFLFSILKETPIRQVRKVFLRKYHGRRRIYESVDLNAVLARLPSRPVIVDLGANQGWFSRRVVDRAGELHAVEPDPLIFEILRTEMSPHGNAFLYNVAIGAKDGTVTFHRHADFGRDPRGHSVSSSVFADHEAIDPSNSIIVPQLGICELIDRIAKPIDLMKIDIEGAEVPVLEQLLDAPHADRVSVILVETHEHVLPDLVERTEALRRRAERLARPRIDMNWH